MSVTNEELKVAISAVDQRLARHEVEDRDGRKELRDDIAAWRVEANAARAEVYGLLKDELARRQAEDQDQGKAARDQAAAEAAARREWKGRTLQAILGILALAAAWAFGAHSSSSPVQNVSLTPAPAPITREQSP